MFKKIEIWILYLVLLFSIIFAVGFGVLVRQELVGSTKAGWISKSALTLAEIPMNMKKILKSQSADLEVEDRFPNLDGFNGTPNDEELYLLLSRYDGDLAESVIELVDLRSFEVKHVWNPDINAYNDLVAKVDEFEYLRRDFNNKRLRLFHPKLTGDGGLLFNSIGPLRKINICSDLVFQNTHDAFHHSIETDHDGNIWVPSHLYPQSLAVELVGRETPGEGGFNDDAIVNITSDGKVLFEKSVSQIFIDNGLEYLLFSVGDSNFDADPIHLNDIQPVNFDGEFWQKGDVFLSLRHQSMILLYRPSTNKIIWKGTGPFFHQHDVDILDNHRISVFNNNSKNFVDGDEVDGHNEVIVYDFKTDVYSRYLSKSLIKNDVRTITEGRSEILPNGELFIEESNFGRTLFFNSDGSLRWSHVNRAENENIYYVSWSRILYTQEDIETVTNLLSKVGDCRG
ncbi:arylsulfotransferase family protein [Planktomarina temperata]|nr:arylsulfotransferase family protein [Planktomarina temperata]